MTFAAAAWEAGTKRQEEKAQEDTASDLASPLLSVCLCDCVSWIRASFALLFTSRTISQDGERERTAARRHIRKEEQEKAKSKRYELFNRIFNESLIATERDGRVWTVQVADAAADQQTVRTLGDVCHTLFHSSDILVPHLNPMRVH